MPPLSTASILSGATIAPTGGSALAFESEGISAGQNPLFASADTDLRTRREILCSVKKPKVSAGAPNGYTQARATALFKSPLELTNGSVTVNTVRIEFAYDVETSQAEIEELRIIAAQICTDADFAEFVKSLSVA
jgi:hypothetical protein